jgi:hypothetical protein
VALGLDEEVGLVAELAGCDEILAAPASASAAFMGGSTSAQALNIEKPSAKKESRARRRIL